MKEINDKKTTTSPKKPHPTERIIDAARTLFFKYGVAAVSTDMLAKEANMSKATMYSRFKSKEEILVAVLDHECKQFFIPAFEAIDNEKDYRQAFINFGVNLLHFLEDPKIVRFDQLMLTQVLENPDMSKLFYKRAYEVTYSHLEDMIAHGQKKGFIKRKETPELLADLLLNSWEGKTYQKLLYGFKTSKFKDHKKHIQTVMAIILEL
ncbi:TetR/AcrR family transcriptional regulator [Exilibacterium tricleocarpae]|nr:TetR/AcrR family transcriptional regulator [Exilibacterium tricleocarpae]